MTYIAGTRGLADFGVPNDQPRVVCDKCGAVFYLVYSRTALPALVESAPDGWKRDITEGKRSDFCPSCR